MGTDVTCIDIDEKIENLRNGIIPIYEPGLEDLAKSNYKSRRLKFTIDLSSVINDVDIITLFLL